MVHFYPFKEMTGTYLLINLDVIASFNPNPSTVGGSFLFLKQGRELHVETPYTTLFSLLIAQRKSKKFAPDFINVPVLDAVFSDAPGVKVEMAVPTRLIAIVEKAANPPSTWSSNIFMIDGAVLNTFRPYDDLVNLLWPK